MIELSGWMNDIDDVIADDEEENRGKKSGSNEDQGKDLYYELANRAEDKTEHKKRVLVGKVEHFFHKINVAAIHLSGNLRVGDMIEIENDDETIRLQVSSMQIDKKNVEEGVVGDSVGIKVDKPVSSGSKVYIMGIDFEIFG